ncbi:MAG: hypothetical protein QW154_03590 [Sulfolobales archaeon]
MSVRRVRVLRVDIEGGDLVLIASTGMDRVPMSSVRRVGTMRKYSRILIVLVIAMAAVSIYTQDFLHTVLTLIMLGVTLATKEEVLIVEMVDGGTIEVSAKDRKSIKKAAEELRKLLTH